MSLQTVMERLDHMLNNSDTPVDIRHFVLSFYPEDVEAGRLLVKAFEDKLVSGNLTSKLVEFNGRISGLTDQGHEYLASLLDE